MAACEKSYLIRVTLINECFFLHCLLGFFENEPSMAFAQNQI